MKSIRYLLLSSVAFVAFVPQSFSAELINEITIVARKRAETSLDVPIAVKAFTAADIQSAGIQRPADFIALTPNMSLVQTQNQGNSFVVIRGISQARNSEPSVAVVIDGVQMTQPAAFNQELFDIDSIEVLKGPQGALYGRNAIGGAIIIQTKQPGDMLEGKAAIGFDNGFGGKIRASVGGPISDTLKFRSAVSFFDTKGYIPNTYLHEKADPFQDLSGRMKLLWTPTEDLTVDTRFNYSRTDTRALYFNIVSDANDVSLPVRVNNPGKDIRHIYDGSIKIDYNKDGLTFTSVTDFNKLDEILTGDAFDFLPITESFFYRPANSPYGFGLGLGFDLNQSQYLKVSSVSQEFRITSPSDKRFRWIAGLYAIGTHRFISTGNMIDTGNGVFPVYETPSTNPLNPQFSFLADTQRNFAWAGFADFEYDVTDKLEAAFSIRYDTDRRKNITDTPPAFLAAVNIPGFPQGVTGEKRYHTFSKWQPKATLRYKVTPSVTAYGSYSQGFRSGGFNQTGVGAVAFSNGIVGVNDIFKAETADTFEVGVKSSILENRVTLDLSGYYTIDHNSYFFVFLAANSTQNLGNIDRATHLGFEAQITANLMEGLDLNLGVGVDHNKITDFPDPAAIGNKLPIVPNYTLNAGLQYRHPVTQNIDATFRVDYQRLGRTYWEPYNTTSRDPVDLVDARAGIEGNSWSLTLWTKNLFNKKYNAEFSPGGFVFKAEPRRWGADLTKNF